MAKYKNKKSSNHKDQKPVKKTSVLLRKEKRKEQRKQVKENRLKSFLRRHGKAQIISNSIPEPVVSKPKEDVKKIKPPSKAEKLAKEQKKQRKKQMLQANMVT